MCRVLVAYASRSGATREIAEAIADELRQTDHTVTLTPCDAAPAAAGFDAVVIGSALYAGRWLSPATRYLRGQAAFLAGRPTRLFQSGPVGEPLEPGATPVPRAVRSVVRRWGLAGPTTFAGRLDPTRITGRLAQWVATATPAGDFRDWDVIRGWAYALGTELQEREGDPRQPPPRGDRPVGSGSR